MEKVAQVEIPMDIPSGQESSEPALEEEAVPQTPTQKDLCKLQSLAELLGKRCLKT